MAYLSDAPSSHRPTRTDTNEETHMLINDSLMGAEIAYRQEKVRQDYRPVRRWTRLRASLPRR